MWYGMSWLLAVVMAACILRQVIGSVTEDELNILGENPRVAIFFSLVWCAFLMNGIYSMSMGMT